MAIKISNTTVIDDSRKFFPTAVHENKIAMPGSNIDLAAGNWFSQGIGGATTLTVTNIPASGKVASFILELTNGGSATVTFSFGSTMKWANGAAPTLTASGRDVLGFFTSDGGTTWSGLLLGKDVK